MAVGRRIRKQQAFDAYLIKWGLYGLIFAINHDPWYAYSTNNPTLYVYTRSVNLGGSLRPIRTLASLLKASKRIKRVVLNDHSQDRQEFDSWDAFREYCMVVKLSGL